MTKDTNLNGALTGLALAAATHWARYDEGSIRQVRQALGPVSAAGAPTFADQVLRFLDERRFEVYHHALQLHALFPAQRDVAVNSALAFAMLACNLTTYASLTSQCDCRGRIERNKTNLPPETKEPSGGAVDLLPPAVHAESFSVRAGCAGSLSQG